MEITRALTEKTQRSSEVAEVMIHELMPFKDAEKSSPVCVFVHGYDSSWKSWHPLADHLQPMVSRMFSLDLPWSGTQGVYWALSEPIFGFLHQGIQMVSDESPILLVGHSFGANMVMEWLCHGDLKKTVVGAVLIAPFYREQSSDFDISFLYTTLKQLQWLVDESIHVQMNLQGRRLPPEILYSMKKKAQSRAKIYTLMQFFQSFLRTPFLSLHTLTFPVLILTGEYDPVADSYHGQLLAKQFLKSCFVQILGSGHYAMLQDPRRVAQEIRHWFSQEVLC